MKGLDKGPKIEFSKLKPGELKVPEPLRELWNELRGQHLLPVVAVLLVGLIAIPVLLGGSSDSESNVEAGPSPIPIETQTSGLTVSKFAPALRDYRHRDAGRSRAENPFRRPNEPKKQASDGESVSETGAPLLTEPTPGSGETGSEGGESSSPETPSKEGSASPPNEEKEQNQQQPAEEMEREAEIDVRVTTIHFDGKTSESLRLGIGPLTKLPADAVPALTYVEPSKDGRAAIMAVSSEVTAIVGQSSCIAKGDPCRLLELKLGKPETLVFGPRGLTYRLKLEKIGSIQAQGNFTKGPSVTGDGRASIALALIAPR